MARVLGYGLGFRVQVRRQKMELNECLMVVAHCI